MCVAQLLKALGGSLLALGACGGTQQEVQGGRPQLASPVLCREGYMQ